MITPDGNLPICEVRGCEQEAVYDSPGDWCADHWQIWMDWGVDHPGEPEPAWMNWRERRKGRDHGPG